jgi:hypothetical protein
MNPVALGDGSQRESAALDRAQVVRSTLTSPKCCSPGLKSAIDVRADVRGYFHWTLFDLSDDQAGCR